MSRKTKHIGIVACSAEGAALCYRAICVEGSGLMGRHDHPEVTMHTHSLADYMRWIEADNWRGVADLILSSAKKLQAAGADFLICPDNTLHQAMPLMLAQSPLPWLHIAGEVGDEAVRRGYRKLGILGTRYLVESDVYPEKLKQRGLDFERPEKLEREEINRIIFDQLVLGDFRQASLEYLQQVIGSLKSGGCDSVVLGCTEIPLLVNDSTSSLPTLDSTRLLARAALRHAVHSEGRAGEGTRGPNRGTTRA